MLYYLVFFLPLYSLRNFFAQVYHLNVFIHIIIFLFLFRFYATNLFSYLIRIIYVFIQVLVNLYFDLFLPYLRNV